MITIEAKEEFYLYNSYHLVKAFFPRTEVVQSVRGEMEDDLRLWLQDAETAAEFVIEKSGDKKEDRRRLDRKLYGYLAGRTGRELTWGTLTGVRPTKLAMKKREEGVSREEFLRWIRERYLVSEEKAMLSWEIANREREILSRLDYRDGFSLYAGIPFCPSVCSYCSFSSGPIDYWRDSVDAYLEALCREISAIGQMMKGKKLNTIYIGGGTPTTLNAGQLERLLSCIDESFSREHLLEYTVEAGRPDTMTEDRLRVIAAHGVTRISINPQTMQQATLERIGRGHTVEDIREAFRLARGLGFDNINMDLIAGLPGETAADMQGTLAEVAKLRPDSLTVHSLAIKRTARMGQEKAWNPAELSGEIARMTGDAARAAEGMDLKPYYLYRQKNIAGNFENVGYAKVDKAGIYNILIMEERQSILAAGAGTSTKILLPRGIPVSAGRQDKITTMMRVENVKNIREYISRIDEMIERKGEWLWR